MGASTMTALRLQAKQRRPLLSEDTGLPSALLCIHPHGDTIVLGGTAIVGEAGLQEGPEAPGHCGAVC